MAWTWGSSKAILVFELQSRNMDTIGNVDDISSVYEGKEDRTYICNYILLFHERHNLEEMNYLEQITEFETWAIFLPTVSVTGIKWMKKAIVWWMGPRTWRICLYIFFSLFNKMNGKHVLEYKNKFAQLLNKGHKFRTKTCGCAPVVLIHES